MFQQESEEHERVHEQQIIEIAKLKKDIAESSRIHEEFRDKYTEKNQRQKQKIDELNDQISVYIEREEIATKHIDQARRKI